MHLLDEIVAPECALRSQDLSAWKLSVPEDPYLAELMYLILARPDADLRKQVCSDFKSYNAAFGLPPEHADRARPAWDVSLDAFMESSDYAIVPPRVLFELEYELEDPDWGPFQSRLYAQALTTAHASILYHQPGVQLTPLAVGVVTTENIERSAALLLSKVEATILPIEVVPYVESTLPYTEVQRLSFANAKLYLPVVLHLNTHALGVLDTDSPGQLLS